MKNTVRFLLYSILFIFCSQIYATDQLSIHDMKRLLGCWNNVDNQNWEYGFFEKFAIYKCDFWEYKSIKPGKNKVEIILQRGDESVRFKVLFNNKSDSICTIISPNIGKKRIVRYSIQPDYTTQDQSAFVNNDFQPDSVTLIGYLRNAHRKQTFKVSINNLLSDEDETYHAEIDSLGRFRMSIPIVNTTGTQINCGESDISISGVFEPKDTLLLYYDYEQKNATRFMGKNARLYHEISNYEQYSSLSRSNLKDIRYNAKMEHDTYLHKQQEKYKKEKEIIGSYLISHPLSSNKFKQYIQTNALTNHISKLMQRRFSLRSNFNKEFLSPAYMSYVDQLFTQMPALFTLSNSTYFLNNYLDYYNGMNQSRTVSSYIEAIRYLNEEKDYPLSEQQKNDLKAYEQFHSTRSMGEYIGADSLLIDSLARPYKQAALRAETFLKDTLLIQRIMEYQSLFPELVEIKFIKDEFLCFDYVQLSPALKEWKVAQTYYEKFTDEKKALSERSIKLFCSLVNNKYYRDVILKQQEYYKSLEKEEVLYSESLKTEPLKESKDADKLFSELITPYKGKIIYLDFWGTWCGPCKSEMKHIPAIKETMKNKDVIFMYLASNSPDKSWRNIIKEYKLTGPNVVHYNLPNEQQNLLEKHFSVNSFPTYILIDKEGNIVDTAPPHPSESEKLISRFDKLLTK